MSYAKHATEIPFQKKNTPFGSFAKSKQYFSGKHSFYRVMTEVSVKFTGHALFICTYMPDSVYNKAIFR